jgi:hypothetical protein
VNERRDKRAAAAPIPLEPLADHTNQGTSAETTRSKRDHGKQTIKHDSTRGDECNGGIVVP